MRWTTTTTTHKHNTLYIYWKCASPRPRAASLSQQQIPIRYGQCVWGCQKECWLMADWCGQKSRTTIYIWLRCVTAIAVHSIGDLYTPCDVLTAHNIARLCTLSSTSFVAGAHMMRSYSYAPRFAHTHTHSSTPKTSSTLHLALYTISARRVCAQIFPFECTRTIHPARCCALAALHGNSWTFAMPFFCRTTARAREQKRVMAQKPIARSSSTLNTAGPDAARVWIFIYGILYIVYLCRKDRTKKGFAPSHCVPPRALFRAMLCARENVASGTRTPRLKQVESVLYIRPKICVMRHSAKNGELFARARSAKWGDS